MCSLLNPDDRALIMFNLQPTEQSAQVTGMHYNSNKHPGDVVHIVTPTLHIKLPSPEFVNIGDQSPVCFNDNTLSSTNLPGRENYSMVDQNEILTLLLLAEKFALDLLHPCDEVSASQLIAEGNISSLRGRVEKMINDERTRRTLMLLLLADEIAKCDKEIDKDRYKDEDPKTLGDAPGNVQANANGAGDDELNEERLRENLLLLLLADQLSSDLSQCENGEGRTDDPLESGNQQSPEADDRKNTAESPKPKMDATSDDDAKEMPDEDIDDDFFASLLLLMMAESCPRKQSQKKTGAAADCGIEHGGGIKSTAKTVPVSKGSTEKAKFISNADLIKYMRQLRELLTSNSKSNPDNKPREQITRKVDPCANDITVATGESGQTRTTDASGGDSSERLDHPSQKLSSDLLALLNACNEASFEDCMSLFMSFLDKQELGNLNLFPEPRASTTCA